MHTPSCIATHHPRTQRYMRTHQHPHTYAYIRIQPQMTPSLHLHNPHTIHYTHPYILVQPGYTCTHPNALQYMLTRHHHTLAYILIHTRYHHTIHDTSPYTMLPILSSTHSHSRTRAYNPIPRTAPYTIHRHTLAYRPAHDTLAHRTYIYIHSNTSEYKTNALYHTCIVRHVRHTSTYINVHTHIRVSSTSWWRLEWEWVITGVQKP